MPPASAREEFIALCHGKDERGDIPGLWDALEANTDLLGPHHFRTLAVAHKLAIALWHANDFGGAVSLLNQALHCLASSFGENHPATLAAKGDLAAVLFELGRDEDAGSLELEAFESARTHLGRTHSVTCVLAWNRAMNCERSGDQDAARQVLTNELTWLLTEDPARLEEDQNIIRGMLAKRLNWDHATTC
jgi:hypothetical protein